MEHGATALNLSSCCSCLMNSCIGQQYCSDASPKIGAMTSLFGIKRFAAASAAPQPVPSQGVYFLQWTSKNINFSQMCSLV